MSIQKSGEIAIYVWILTDERKDIMKVLVIGSGGREHALAWKLAQSKNLDKLYIAPGNPGTAQCGENIPIDGGDIEKLLEFAK